MRGKMECGGTTSSESLSARTEYTVVQHLRFEGTPSAFSHCTVARGAGLCAQARACEIVPIGHEAGWLAASLGGLVRWAGGVRSAEFSLVDASPVRSLEASTFALVGVGLFACVRARAFPSVRRYTFQHLAGVRSYAVHMPADSQDDCIVCVCSVTSLFSQACNIQACDGQHAPDNTLADHRTATSAARAFRVPRPSPPR